MGFPIVTEVDGFVRRCGFGKNDREKIASFRIFDCLLFSRVGRDARPNTREHRE
jgi:hypothetical protein